MFRMAQELLSLQQQQEQQEQQEQRKIGDFGLSRNIHSTETWTSDLTSRVGTQDYMAPEVCSNEYDLRADLYSLGLVIWEVVQLIPFRNRKSLFDRLVNDGNEDLVQHHHAIPEVAKLIHRLTKRRAKDRLKNMGEVADLVRKWKKPKYRFYQNESDMIRPPIPVGKDVLMARNSSELQTCLAEAKTGSTIKVFENECLGKFVIDKDHITLIGEGSAVFCQS